MPPKAKMVWHKLDLATIESPAEDSKDKSRGKYGGKRKGKSKAARASQSADTCASGVNDTDCDSPDDKPVSELAPMRSASTSADEALASDGNVKVDALQGTRLDDPTRARSADSTIEMRSTKKSSVREDSVMRQPPTMPSADRRRALRHLSISTSSASSTLHSALPSKSATPVSVSRKPHSATFEMSSIVRNTFSAMINKSSREFPSLGAPLQQQSSAAPSMWSNPSLRTSSQQAQVNLQRNPQSLQLQSEDLSHFGSSNEGYRFGGATNQLAGLAQTPTQGQGGDDFPPLGENESRNNLLGAFSSGPGAGLDSRLGLGQTSEQPLRGLGDRNPTPRGRTLTNPNPFPVPETTQPLGFASGLGSIGLSSGFSNSSSLAVRSRSSQLDYPQTDSNALSPDFGQSEPQNPSSATGAPRSRQVSGPSTRLRLADMTPRQREGLLGLAARLDPEHPDFSPMALGQDLTQLGLDLNRSDSTPLFATFATPFGPANQAVRPAVPDFTLPAAYKVQNVPPLHEKIPSFSDEGLLAVFYTMPRDLAQEMAAQELYNRDWRWHMRHAVWLQKDTNYPAPTRVNMKEERGFYVVWNATNWRKERRELTLIYDDLEQRTGPQGFN